MTQSDGVVLFGTPCTAFSYIRTYDKTGGNSDNKWQMCKGIFDLKCKVNYIFHQFCDHQMRLECWRNLINAVDGSPNYVACLNWIFKVTNVKTKWSGSIQIEMFCIPNNYFV